MREYDAHRLMLDPGRTALALRGLHDRDGHYPFLDGFKRRGRSPQRSMLHESRWRRALRWWFFMHRSPASV